MINVTFFETALDADRQLHIKVADNEKSDWSGVIKVVQSILAEQFPKQFTFGASNADEQLYVLLVQMRDLVKDDLFFQLKEKVNKTELILRPCVPTDEIKNYTYDFEKKPLYPMITIGTENIMELYSEDELLKPEERDFRYDLSLNVRIKYFDNSIWNRYVPFSAAFLKDFQAILTSVVENYHKGLYYTLAARATLEFQTRMMLNSFIAKVGARGHNKRVTPFKFHSETQMKHKADKLEEEFFKEIGYWDDGVFKSLKKEIKWHFLLVDDQANTLISSTPNKHCSESKVSLIKRLLTDFEIEIEHTKGEKADKGIVGKCKEKMKEEVYDVILLDYLLGEEEENEEREYGHDFMRALVEDSKQLFPLLKKGPFRRYWIFPISSFPFALNDKLNQLGISHLNRIWHLSNGSDPIATPQLFRYYLLNFLYEQISIKLLHPDALKLLVQRFSNPGRSKAARIRWIDDILHTIEIRGDDRIKDEIRGARKSRRNDLLSTLSVFVKGFNTDDQTPIAQLSTVLQKLKRWLKSKDEEIEQELFHLIEALEDYPNEKYNNALTSITTTFRRILDPDYEKLLGEIIKIQKCGEEELIFEENVKNIPIEIGMLKELKRLNLYGNQLSIIPATISNLSELLSLDLQSNSFRYFPSEILAVKNLEYLNLSQNPISSVPLGILQLNKLREIDLRNTRINYPFDLIAKGETAVQKLLKDIIQYQHNQFTNSIEENIIKIIFISANPKRLGNLQLLTTEYNVITEYDKDIKIINSKRFKIEKQDFLNTMPKEPIDILHFSGHGTEEGTLVMEDGKLNRADLRKYFVEFTARHPCRCVILNACFSHAVAKAIQPFIPYVISFKRSIGDTEAVDFSKNFYRRLSEDDTIKEAGNLAELIQNIENKLYRDKLKITRNEILIKELL